MRNQQVLGQFCQCLFQTLFVSVYFRHFLMPFLNLLAFSHLKSLKLAGCLGRFQLRIALNLPKCVLFINNSRLPCLFKICYFYIASLDRFLYPGGEGSFSAEKSKLFRHFLLCVNFKETYSCDLLSITV